MDAYSELKRFSDVLEEVAHEFGIPICVTVVDPHGHVMLLRRMPGYTAQVMDMETAALAPMVMPGEPLYTLTSSSSRLIAFGGGTCVRYEDASYGIGISGGTTAQDMEMLKAAQERFNTGDWAESVLA
jgi:uncharacterized protein GlcG (DUF336 family)